MVESAPGIVALQGEIRRRRLGRSAGAWECGGRGLDGVALWLRFGACAAVGGVMLALCLVCADGAAASGWAVQPTPGPRGGTLLAVSCMSPRACIAVGSSSNPGNGRPAKTI